MISTPDGAFATSDNNFSHEGSTEGFYSDLSSSDENNVSIANEYYDGDEYTFQMYPFEFETLGLLQPIFILLTILTNVFVIGFFFSGKKRGKATNLLFISIALSDSLTGLTLLPNSFYVYANKNDILTRDWCYTYMYLKFYVSMVFHTVSVWQTVLLGIHRYMCICHPFISGHICTFWKTFVCIVIMYILASILHIYHVTDDKIDHHICAWKVEIPCKLSCMYLWFCVIFQHFGPCFLLLGLTIVTILKLQQTHKRASFLSLSSSDRRSSRDRIITVTTTLIVVCFLIPELPHGVYKLVFVFYKHFGNSINNFENHVFIAIYEIALILSFHANFWIYCAMMNDFRQAFFKIATCGVVRVNVAFRSSSVSSSKNSIHTTLSNNSSFVGRNRILSQTTSVHSATLDNFNSVTSQSHLDIKRSSPEEVYMLPSNPSSDSNTYARLMLRSVSSENRNELCDDVFV